VKNFAQLTGKVDTKPLLTALEQNANLWNIIDFRKRTPITHDEVDDIILRFDDITRYSGGMDCVNYLPYKQLCPAVEQALSAVKHMVNGDKIGRLVITRISPGKGVKPHIDTDRASQHYRRYHLCLYGVEGNTFTAGDETVTMRTGEVWWFDNTITHHCMNTGSEDRIHLIFDISVLPD
jgi:hypothetical protein